VASLSPPLKEKAEQWCHQFDTYKLRILEKFLESTG